MFKGNSLAYPLPAQQRYRDSLLRLIGEMTDEYERKLTRYLKQFPQVAQDASPTRPLTLILTELAQKWAREFARRSSVLAERMINQVDVFSKANLGNSLKEMSGGLTIKTPMLPAGLSSRIASSTAENVALIRNLPQEYAKRIQGLMLRSVQTGGKGASQIFEEIRHYGDMTRSRAELIAVDRTRKITTVINSERMKSAGVRQFEWIHSGGGAEPRPLHVEYDGQIFDLDDPPVIDERTGEKGLPGQLINCHTGESIVDLSNGCAKLYRRIYSGELVSIISDDGVILNATPNHPILTNRGWLPIKLINEGDYVVSRAKKSVNICEAYVYDSKSTFSDVFDFAFDLVGGAETFIGSPRFEFHGDISDSDVNIIDIDSFLPGGVEFIVAKEVIEFFLTCSDMKGVTTSFSKNCAMDALINGITFSDERILSGFSSLFPEFGGESFSTNGIGLRAISYFNTVLDQNSSNCGARGIEFFRKFKNAHTGQIETGHFFFRQLLSLFSLWGKHRKRNIVNAELLGEVVGVAFENRGNLFDCPAPIQKFSRIEKKFVRKDFCGHVYNLENELNWYYCNDIVSHNCRCRMRPIVDFTQYLRNDDEPE